MWLIATAGSKVLKLAKVEKSSGNNSAAKANPAMHVRLKQYAATKGSLNMEMLQEESNANIKLVKNRHFKDEFQKIRQKEGSLGKERQLSTLNPFMCKHGIIRAGGRLRRSRLSDECKNLIILPRESKVTNLIVKWCHYNTAHSGRGMTLNKIRWRGFGVICGSSVVKPAILKYVTCSKRRGKIMNRWWLTYLRTDLKKHFKDCTVDTTDLKIVLSICLNHS